MTRNITDRILLKTIYDLYYEEFCSFENDAKQSRRSNKIYVPIDCERVANKLNLDTDIVFGRLYYHLDKKYGYTQEDGARVHLFSMAVGRDRHCVHFPMLSAVMAELEQSHYRFTLPLIVSFIALFISIASLVVA
jgi:hypothetical protein